MLKQLLSFIIICVIFISVITTAKAAQWHWAGYFGVNYEDSTKADSTGAFDAYVLSLIPNFQVNDRLNILSQIDFEHGPFFDISLKADGAKELDKRSSGEITLSKAYAHYVFNDYLQINVGKFFAPIGLYNQLLYAVPSYPTLKIPAASVYSRGSTPVTDALFFQRYVMGVWLTGVSSVNKWNLSYDAYLSNGRSFRQHIDDNAHKSIGGRIQVGLGLPIRIDPLLSFYGDEYNAGTPALPLWKKQNTYIPGVTAELENLVVKGEFASSKIKNADDGKSQNFSAYYAEVYYTLQEKLTPYWRYEFYEPNADLANDQEKEITAGVVYHLALWEAMVKFQIRFHQYENAAKSSYQVYGLGLAAGF